MTRALRVLLSSLCLCAVVQADPAEVEVHMHGEAGALRPRANPEVTMVAERVEFFEPELTQDAAGRWTQAGEAWTVRAHYVFQSGSRQERVVHMAFPVAPEDREEWNQEEETQEAIPEDHPALGTGDFTVRVDGNEVATELRTLDCQDEPCPLYGQEFVVTFAPRGSAEVDCEYRQAPALAEGEAGALGLRIPFILRTGALWHETIGSVELIYHLATPAARLGVAAEAEFDEPYPSGSAYQLHSPYDTTQATFWNPPAVFDLAVACADGQTTVKLAARDVEPAGDIWLAVPGITLRVQDMEQRGCDNWSGWHAPVQDCCTFLSAPTRLERLGLSPEPDSDTEGEDVP